MRRLLMLFVVIFLSVPAIAYGDCNIPKDYTLTRPDPIAGPTKVKLGLFLNDISKVVDVESQIKVDFFLRLEWQDLRLLEIFKNSDTESCFSPVATVWSPPWIIINRADLDEQYKDWVEIYPDGSVVIVQRYYGNLTAPIYLKDFPMDDHAFPINIGSYYDKDRVLLEIDERTTRADKFSVSNWKFGEGSAHLDIRKGKFLETENSTFQYVIRGKRDRVFYFWDVVFPVLLIVLMSWTVFWISPQHRVAQISLSATSFLTLIAFQIRQSDLTPNLPYLTRLDIFNFVCSFFIFLSLSESVLTGVLAGRGDEEKGHRIDFFSRFIFPFFFSIAVLYIFYG